MEPANGSISIYDDSIIYTHNIGEIDSFTIVDDNIMYIIYVKVYQDLKLLAAPYNNNLILQLTKPNLNGEYKIFDYVGNVITTGDIINSKAIWNYTNQNNRIIAPQAYLILAKVKYKNKNVIIKSLIKVKPH